MRVFILLALLSIALSSTVTVKEVGARSLDQTTATQATVNQNKYKLPKTDCHPLNGANEDKCKALGCVWQPIDTNKVDNGEDNDRSSTLKPVLEFEDIKQWTKDEPASDIKEPWCFMPGELVNYELESQSTDGSITLRLVKPSGVPRDVKRVRVETRAISNQAIRVRITDAENPRFEPLIPVLNIDALNNINNNNNNDKKMQLEVEISNTKDVINNSPTTITNSIEVNHQQRMQQQQQQQQQPPVLTIRRSETGATLFETDLSKLIFGDQFIQLNSNLNSKFVFGLGEHYDFFTKRADAYSAYSFFHTDKLPLPNGRRSYGSFPFYVNLDSNNTRAHAVYLRNSNAMDIVLQADQSISFRPTGGILDFIIFVGPTPYEAIAQFQQLVGLPQLPPRWTLGFHLCRYDWGSVEKTELVWQRTRDAKIPFDAIWNDIDYMEHRNDFTYDRKNFKTLPEFVNKVHESDMHYVILFDPGVSEEPNYEPFSLGMQMNVFIKNSSDLPLVGRVWNYSNRTVFPDFTNEKSTDYWSQLFVKFHKLIQFDAAWIDMNDISSFVDGSLYGCPANNSLENPPYLPGGLALHKNTLCMTARHKLGYEYDLHNLYSFYESIATEKALKAIKPTERTFILSRSTSIGQGKFSSHWSGDLASTWSHLRWSIPSLLEHSMYGYSLMGSDICGFVGDTTVELCARWSTLGAFYSFSRNHNDDVARDQDPVALGEIVTEATRNAQQMRYKLLPYLYSLLHLAHRLGEPFARSLALDYFTSGEHAFQIEDQFLVGKALLVAPIVYEGKTDRIVHLPPGRWYQKNIAASPSLQYNNLNDVNDNNLNSYVKHSALSLQPLSVGSSNAWTEVEVKNVSLTDLPLFFAGGHVIPTYSEVALTTKQIVRQPLTLIAFLCEMYRARGEVYLDDGITDDDNSFDHLQFHIANQTLNIEMDVNNYKQMALLKNVEIYGLQEDLQVSSVIAKPVGKKLKFLQAPGALIVELDEETNFVSKEQPLQIVWS